MSRFCVLKHWSGCKFMIVTCCMGIQRPVIRPGLPLGSALYPGTIRSLRLARRDRSEPGALARSTPPRWWTRQPETKHRRAKTETFLLSIFGLFMNQDAFTGAAKWVNILRLVFWKMYKNFNNFLIKTHQPRNTEEPQIECLACSWIKIHLRIIYLRY